MDTFISSLLLTLLLLSLSLIFFHKKKRSGDPKNVPPGSYGWPILEENMEIAVLGFPKFVKNRIDKYSSNVFRTSIMGEKVAVFSGAQGNKFVFTNDENILPPCVPRSMKKIIHPDVKQSSWEEGYALLHKSQNDVLKPKALREYIPVMDSLAREQLDNDWRPNTVVKVSPWTNKYNIHLSCRLFLTLADGDRRIDTLSESLAKIILAFVSLPIDLPGTAYNRAVKAGKMARADVGRILKERREEMMRENNINEKREGMDLLSKMLTLTDDDGKYVSDEIVVAYLVGFLLASYQEAASAATLAIYHLAQLPHIYEGVFKEQMEIAKSKDPEELLTWDDIEKMKYTWNVVREILRLFPLAGTFRRVTDELTYENFTIPQGWKMFWTSHSSHMNPDYFPEPEKFDPSRFEGSGPAPYTYLPFGGGSRMCPGRSFAKASVLVLIHNVVTRFRLQKAIPSEKIVLRLAHYMPAHDLPLHLHPHHK